VTPIGAAEDARCIQHGQSELLANCHDQRDRYRGLRIRARQLDFSSFSFQFRRGSTSLVLGFSLEFLFDVTDDRNLT
jgi:hypothetical protein